MADFQWTDLLPVASGLISYGITSNAADKASAAQQAAAQQGINAYSPYTQLGASSVEQVRNLLGLGGADAQQTAISGIQASPEFQSMLKQGESSILANAAATGGLRGGNTQAALAQFSPALLSNLINQKVGTYTGLANSGQNAAGSIANLYAQQGAARAGGATTQANALSGLLAGIGAYGAYQGWGDKISSGVSDWWDNLGTPSGYSDPDSSYWTNMDQGSATPDEINMLFD